MELESLLRLETQENKLHVKGTVGTYQGRTAPESLDGHSSSPSDDESRAQDRPNHSRFRMNRSQNQGMPARRLRQEHTVKAELEGTQEQ